MEARVIRRLWTEEEWLHALKMNTAGATPQAIAVALKRPAQSVYSKFGAKGVPLNMQPPVKRSAAKPPKLRARKIKIYEPGKPWPRDMYLRALAMADGSTTSEQIASAFGAMVTAHDVRTEFGRQGKSRQLPDTPISTDLSILEERLAEAARYRAAQDRRDVSASVFGDPPPGWSALDRIRAAEKSR